MDVIPRGNLNFPISEMNKNWIRVCKTSEIDEEDLIRFDYEGRSFCIYHTPDGYFVTDGYCTHEREHLEYGFVMGHIIECPLHQGRFDIRSGKALGAPVCIDLGTWPLKIEDDEIYIDILSGDSPRK